MLLVRGEERISLRGVRAEGHRDRVRRFASGRVCEEAGCTTRLSMYNPSPWCWVHDSPRRYFPVRGRPRKDGSR
jgi:hypothetical protein